MANYIAFDCETGGLDTNVSSLLTAYFIVFDENFKSKGELYLKIKPDRGQHYQVTAEALNVNKIDLVKHEAEAIPLSQAKSELYNFLQTHNADGKSKLIPVGHNVYFDEELVITNLISRANWHKFVSFRRLDTGVILQFLKLAGLLPVNISGSLTSIVEHFNLSKGEQMHDAKNDTVATVKVLRAMLRAARRE